MMRAGPDPRSPLPRWFMALLGFGPVVVPPACPPDRFLRAVFPAPVRPPG